jgi:hypothetical protein
MSRILEIQKKSNDWLSNFEANVIRIIESGQEKTIDLNKKQMLGHKDADGKPLIHKSTGKETLSKQYARKTGKKKPNFFVTGEFQNAMFLFMPDEKQYFIGSKDRKVEWLSENYGQKIFGVAPDNHPKAQAINDKAIIEDYLKLVFQT